MSDISVTYLTGHMEIPEVEYRLTKRIRTKKFLFFEWNITEYCIETNYATLASFKSKDEAYVVAGYGGIDLKDETW